MKKSVKGALAAAAGATLMLGGAGSLAYWSDSKDVGTAAIDSGKITLSAPDCATAAGAHGWQLDNGDAFTPGTTKVVPGDTISKVCDMTLTLVGQHIGATLAIDTPTIADAASTLDTELVPTATFTVDGNAYAAITAPGVHTVRATVTVQLPSTVTSSTSQNATVALNAINVTATQTHDTVANGS